MCLFLLCLPRISLRQKASQKSLAFQLFLHHSKLLPVVRHKKNCQLTNVRMTSLVALYLDCKRYVNTLLSDRPLSPPTVFCRATTDHVHQSQIAWATCGRRHPYGYLLLVVPRRLHPLVECAPRPSGRAMRPFCFGWGQLVRLV